MMTNLNYANYHCRQVADQLFFNPLLWRVVENRFQSIVSAVARNEPLQHACKMVSAL